MKKLIYIILTIAVLSQYAHAGGIYIGKIRPHYWGSGLYLTPINPQVTDKPPCATRNLLQLHETDPNDPIFKNKYSMILSLWLAGKEVELRGTGNCTSQGDEIIYVVIPH